MVSQFLPYLKPSPLDSSFLLIFLPRDTRLSIFTVCTYYTEVQWLVCFCYPAVVDWKLYPRPLNRRSDAIFVPPLPSYHRAVSHDQRRMPASAAGYATGILSDANSRCISFHIVIHCLIVEMSLIFIVGSN